MTHHTSHITHHTSHITHHRSSVLLVRSNAHGRLAFAVSVVGAFTYVGCSSPAEGPSPDELAQIEIEQIALSPESPTPSVTGTCVIDNGSGPVLYACPSEFRDSTEEEDEYTRRAVEQLGDGIPYEAPPTPADDRDELLATVSARPGTSVMVLVRLPDVDFNWAWFREQSPDTGARSQAIEIRRKQVDALFVDVVQDLKKLGIVEVRRFWSEPLIGFDIDSIQVAEALASWPEEREVWLDRKLNLVPTQQQRQEAYTGKESRTSAQVDDYHSNGYWGQTGSSKYGGPIRIGIVEPPPKDQPVASLNYAHPGFSTTLFGMKFTRFLGQMYRCDGSGCVAYTPNPIASHGTEVASVALGTIENGQDPNIVDPQLQVERSGIAPKVIPYFFSISPLDSSTPRLIEKAAELGIDILNHSYEEKHTDDNGIPIYDPCVPPTGSNEKWNKSLFEGTHRQGILNVFSAGNESHSAGCSIRYPAGFRQGLAVGSLDSSSTSYNPHSLGMFLTSSKGGMDIIVNGVRHLGAESGVDLVAAGCHSRMYGNSTSMSAEYGLPPGTMISEGCGTSYAAPVVAGTAALIRQFFVDIGFPELRYPGPLLANTILMTDGWSATINDVPPKGFDNISGAGRLHTVYGLVPPQGWGCRSAMLSNLQKTLVFPVGDSGPESPLVKMWKGVMVTEEPDRSDAAHITMTVQDTCPLGGGSPVVVASDDGYGTRKRIRLVNPLQIANRCLEVVVKAVHLQNRAGNKIHVCDYFHSDPDPTNH